jgi:glycosyltransferase involved in cell wall biosynthesis
MKILIIVDNIFDNDIRVQRQCIMLDKAGYELVILCYDEGGKYKTYNKWTVIRYKISKFKKAIVMPLEIRLGTHTRLWSNFISKQLIANQPNLVVAHDMYMAKPTKLAIVKSKLNIKFILDLHETYPHAVQSYGWTQSTLRKLIAKPKKWLELEESYLNYADAIIFLSDSFRNRTVARYPFLKKENTMILPNVSDIDFLNAQNIDLSVIDTSTEKCRIFYFGLISQARGVFDLINVVNEAIDLGANFELILVGPVVKSDKLEFNDCLHEDLNKKFIKYIPWININNLMSYLNIVDICVSPLWINPQHESGIANKVFQYMFGGKPLVVSNCKPQAELVLKTNSGFVYKDLLEFRDILLKLEADKHLRIELGQNGKRAIEGKYNLNHFSVSYIKFINKILSNG